MPEPRKPEDELADQPQGIDVSEINAADPGMPGDNGGFAIADGDPMGAVPPAGDPPPAEPDPEG
jgi:hypothetical protein